MNCRRTFCLWLNTLVFAIGLVALPSSAAPVLPVLARIHWLGLNQISADTNSAQFMKVWHLPQTTALVSQTLDKLSCRPGGGATNAASAMLRPLLDDLITSEFQLELYSSTNHQPSTLNSQLLLAVHLPASRAQLWQTNLAAALQNLTGTQPISTEHGWRFQQLHPPEQIEFSHADEWTVIGVGHGAHELIPQFAASLVSHASSPVTRHSSRSNDWLETDIDLAQFAAEFSFSDRHVGDEVSVSNPPSIFHLPSSFSKFKMTLSGENGHVLTRGTLTLSQPWKADLPAWEIPTNYIYQSYSGFTAVRGIAARLAGLPAWQKTRLAPPPDQMFFWAQSGIPFQTYVAAPLPMAGNQLSQLAARLVQQGNPWLATNGQGNFQGQTNPPGIIWNDALIISPWLKAVTVDQHDWLLGGLYPLTPGDASPAPADILHPVLDTPGLVYYQTEQTGTRVDAGLFITQLFRVVFHKPQLPPAAVATQWLKHVELLLNASTTEVIRASPRQLSITRKSTIGLSAFELHLLADWLESPQFPRGLHTFLAPPEK